MKTEYQISGVRENGGVHEMVTEVPSLVALKSPTADRRPECNTQGKFTNTLWIINTRICSNTQRRTRSKLTAISGWNMVFLSVEEATVYTNNENAFCLIWQVGRFKQRSESGQNAESEK